MENEKNKETKKSRKMLIIILIIIIILLLMFLLGYKVGKIGFQETSAEPSITGIILQENDMETIKNNQLNIFNNEKFNNKKIIAPHSKGTYRFFVKNDTNRDISYNIKFSDEMQYFVNMKYKLKIDNVYIRGNSEEYTTMDQLSVDNITVLKDSINIYTLEWYWEDNDKLDTHVGSQENGRYYTLNLEIEPSEYNK